MAGVPKIDYRPLLADPSFAASDRCTICSLSSESIVTKFAKPVLPGHDNRSLFLQKLTAFLNFFVLLTIDALVSANAEDFDSLLGAVNTRAWSGAGLKP